MNLHRRKKERFDKNDGKYVYSKRCESSDGVGTDFDEQRKIAEGADALLNLAGVSTPLIQGRTPAQGEEPDVVLKTHETTKIKRRSNTTSEFSANSEKKRRRWREWGEGTRYLKQVRG